MVYAVYTCAFIDQQVQLVYAVYTCAFIDQQVQLVAARACCTCCDSTTCLVAPLNAGRDARYQHVHVEYVLRTYVLDCAGAAACVC